MCSYARLRMIVAGLALWAVPAWGQFQYSESFETVTPGTKPPGWNTLNNQGLAYLDPVVMTADTSNWALQSYLGLNGVQNYAVPWSDSALPGVYDASQAGYDPALFDGVGHRFNLIHSGQDPLGRAAGAWYSGVDGPHTGAYPMDLTAQSFRAEFDLSIRWGTSSSPADGGVFAILPVFDFSREINSLGANGGGMAWAGLAGVAIEFDFYNNNLPTTPPAGSVDPDLDGWAGGQNNNHIGLDTYLKWYTRPQCPATGTCNALGADIVNSVVTNVEMGSQAFLPDGPDADTNPDKMWSIGDNNQPLHFTVYYNDPAHGGLGQVQVYLRIDPQSKAAGDPAVPALLDGKPYSFGTTTGNPDGQLILEACVGPMPVPQAIFGFTGSSGGSNCIYQVDNIKVATEIVDPGGTACPIPALPTFNKGTAQTLDVNAKVAACDAVSPSDLGWNVNVYPAPWVGSVAATKASVFWSRANGHSYAENALEPDLNFNDNGCAGRFANDRRFPGLPSGQPANHRFAVVAKGYICFPQAGEYVLHFDSDDGYEIRVASSIVQTDNTVGQLLGSFDAGRGCSADPNTTAIGQSRVALTVPPGGEGVYPIQILYWQGTGSSGMEFFRIIPPSGWLARDEPYLVGADDYGLTGDQPLVYSKLGGAAAPDLVSTYSTMMPPGYLSNNLVLSDPGIPVVTLTAAPEATINPLLSQEGWDVKTYLRVVGGSNLQGLRDSIGLAESSNMVLSHAIAESDLNYIDTDCGGIFANSRRFPGLPGIAVDTNFGMMATGWIVFPVADTYTLEFDSDDGYEIIIGNTESDGVVTAGQQVIYADASRGSCNPNPASWNNMTPTDATYNRRFQLIVQTPGVYSIQILWYQGTGGAGTEFWNVESFRLIGQPADGDPAKQPVVYGLLNGKPAPAQTFTAGTPTAAIPLLASQKVAGTPGGQPGFNIKVVEGPAGLNIDVNYEEDVDTLYRGWLAVMDNLATGAEALSEVVNYRGVGQDDGFVPNGKIFPIAFDQFGFEATGYAVLEAGLYMFEINSDDNVMFELGQQVIYSGDGGRSEMFPVNVAEAGVYPIRVQLREGSGGNKIELGEVVPGVGLVAVNAPESRIKVWTEIDSGPYTFRPIATSIPTSRKVAEYGAGGTPGWNVLLAKSPGVQLTRVGEGTALLENSLACLTPSSGFAAQGIDETYPLAVNYGNDTVTALGRFAGDRNIDSGFTLLPGPTTPWLVPGTASTDYAIRATGYIEFPAAGVYGLDVASDDGYIMWIAGTIVGHYRTTRGSTTAGSPVFVYVSEPGIYNIRAEMFNRSGGSSMEVFEYLPDRSRALINSDRSRLKAYRDLPEPPASAKYANAVRVPAAAKAATLEDGLNPGARVRVVTLDVLSGNATGGRDHDPLRHMNQAAELLDAVLYDIPSINQAGHVQTGSDVVLPTIQLANHTLPGWASGTDVNDIAAQFEGYLALTAGGHVFRVNSDNGFNLWIGSTDRNQAWHIGQSGSLHNRGSSTSSPPYQNYVDCYVHVEQDGLYPFVLHFLERDGGDELFFDEVVLDGTTLVTLPVNGTDLRAARMYAEISPCPKPWADADEDGDIDQVDFGVFQLCYTGLTGPEMDAACRCFDRQHDGEEGYKQIDLYDLAEFMNCAAGSGPNVPFDTDNPPPGCNPLTE